MPGLGVLPHVVERILNHKTGVLGGVAGIYNRFAYQQEMSEALNRWSQHLENLIRKGQSSVIETKIPLYGVGRIVRR